MRLARTGMPGRADAADRTAFVGRRGAAAGMRQDRRRGVAAGIHQDAARVREKAEMRAAGIREDGAGGDAIRWCR